MCIFDRAIPVSISQRLQASHYNIQPFLVYTRRRGVDWILKRNQVGTSSHTTMPWWSRPPTGSNPSERPSSRADQEDFLDRWFESVMRQNEDAFHRGMFGGNFGHNHPYDNDGRHQHSSFSASYSSSYQMHEDDKQIQIAVDVPGMSREDLDVKVTSQAGPYSPCVVELGAATSGEKGVVAHGEGKSDESQRGPPRRLLGQRFRLGKNVDCDHLAANLSKGVLLLTAPKFQPEPEPESATRSIPITERDG